MRRSYIQDISFTIACEGLSSGKMGFLPTELDRLDTLSYLLYIGCSINLRTASSDLLYRSVRHRPYLVPGGALPVWALTRGVTGGNRQM